jgi:hypothetical protein
VGAICIHDRRPATLGLRGVPKVRQANSAKRVPRSDVDGATMADRIHKPDLTCLLSRHVARVTVTVFRHRAA